MTKHFSQTPESGSSIAQRQEEDSQSGDSQPMGQEGTRDISLVSASGVLLAALEQSENANHRQGQTSPRSVLQPSIPMASNSRITYLTHHSTRTTLPGRRPTPSEMAQRTIDVIDAAFAVLDDDDFSGEDYDRTPEQ